jgi:hypothetical protein
LDFTPGLIQSPTGEQRQIAIPHVTAQHQECTFTRKSAASTHTHSHVTEQRQTHALTRDKAAPTHTHTHSHAKAQHFNARTHR